uniref:Eukaryotic translation initiation factor 1 n=1 Tax=Gallus gallus TaxID=9031 RepID=A0A8V0ZWX3_CHICK
MSAIQNLQPFDPFADASKGDDLLPAGTEDYIHIRIQQRNGRKTLTTVQGIADDYDKKKLVKAFKKVGCGRCVGPGGQRHTGGCGAGVAVPGFVVLRGPSSFPRNLPAMVL